MVGEHGVVVVTGLGDKKDKLIWATNGWKDHGLSPEVHVMPWKDDEPFEPKLQRLVEKFWELKKKFRLVSLVGTSAGGSAVLAAYTILLDEVCAVANVCGRIRPGTNWGIRGFDLRTRSCAFREAVLYSEHRQSQLNHEQRKRIATFRSAVVDELVPPDTVVIDGAINKVVPFFEHGLCIGIALRNPKYVVRFLKMREQQS
jgi:hypothetical protein